MSGYTVYAIAGLGRIGLNLAQEFLAMKVKDPRLAYSVRALTTQSTSDAIEDLAVNGANVRTVSYESPASILAALDGVDVLMSCIGYEDGGLHAQMILGDLAKAAGVKLVVPSEYGAQSDAVKDENFTIKEVFRKRLIANGLKYAVFYTGFWSDFVLRPFILRDMFQIDLEKGNIHKWIDWDTPLSFTTQMDIARYVTHVLVYLPRSELENRIFRIQADSQTLNSLFVAFLEKTSRPPLANMKTTTHSRAELDEKLDKEPLLIGLRLFRAADDEMFSVSADGKLDSAIWPEWKPERTVDVMIRSFVAAKDL
ncbi:hypothetical protein DFH07DRAFT_857535 [Mycena maculata]|uniref:NmrA-like domain-containing protein n=1 Tax=Mycena maculata TaxID=230809 RepID=A0AAD7MKG8_9AGAR|nr:hypothetical protein DFH07DRAFT_857535 [Mycena maculata]